MKEYSVTIPTFGHIVVYVTAESEEEAKQKAFEEADFTVKGGKNTEPLDFELHESTGRGNVCYLQQPWDIQIEVEEEL